MAGKPSAPAPAAALHSPEIPDEPLTPQEQAMVRGDVTRSPEEDYKRTQKAPPEIEPPAPPQVPRFRLVKPMFDGERLWPINSELNWEYPKHTPPPEAVPLNQAAFDMMCDLFPRQYKKKPQKTA
jgi:hypothetical protein